MIDIDTLIIDKPQAQKLHILESMIFGFSRAFEGRNMPQQSQDMYDGMVAKYYRLLNNRVIE